MHPRIILGLALAGAVALPLSIQAQEAQPEAGELSSVAVWQVDPADLGDFMAVAAQVVQAAREAELEPQYGWTMWQDMYTITVVGQFDVAELENPQHWVEQFMGTPGEATLMEAFQNMENVDILRSHSEIYQHMPAWSYSPDGMSEPPMGAVRVNEFWLKGGEANYQQWNALIDDFLQFFAAIEYPYPIWGYTVRYGDNRTVFVTAYDEAGAYFGANSPEVLAERHGMADQWMELLGRMGQLVLSAEVGDAAFLPGQSYIPGAEETASR